MKWKTWEKKWQMIWEKHRVFEADPKEGKRKFYITVPYPYTSGALHIGHGRTYTIGDVIARFYRTQGFNVLFPMAFHITGTPILSISDRIARGDEKTIKLYRQYVEIYEKDPEKVEKILQSFKDPKKVAEFFADKIIHDFKSIGYSIDWRRKFNTGEKIYNTFVTWQYLKLKEKGVLVRGKHPLLFSLEEKQPVGEDDIVDGDVDKVTIQEFVAIKFPLVDGTAALLAATLRPETIFGTTNLWINPDADYVEVEVENTGERWIISTEAKVKFEFQGWKFKELRKFKGKMLVGRKVQVPLTGRAVEILPASFVDPDNATGVVYSVPAHAPYDYAALRDAGVEIEPIVIISLPGRKIPAKEIVEEMGIKSQKDPRLEEATRIIYKEEFYNGVLLSNCGEFAGLRVGEAKEKVKEKLLKEKMAVVLYETSRKAITRSGSKVIVAVLEDQWFIDYTNPEWKRKAHEWVDKMLIYPEKFRKFFHDTIDWLEKRPCARRRGLGTPLVFDPSWIIEPLSDSTIYMAFYTVVHHLRPYESKVKPEVFEYIFLGNGKPEEIAEATGIPKEVLEKARKEFLYWYPLDLRHTAPAHISNHLTFFIMHHIAIFPQELWPRAITLNELLIREGVKMSKSKGNVIPLAHVAEKYGADLYRLYVIASADLDAVVDWREKDVASVRAKLERFVELMEQAVEEKAEELKQRVEKWFLARFYRRLEKARELYKSFKLRDAIIEVFFKNLNDLSWVAQRGGRVAAVVKEIARDWLVALMPVIPHTAEEFWHRFGFEGFASLALWQEKTVEFIEETEEEYLRAVIENIREVMKLANTEKVREIWLYTSQDEIKRRAVAFVLEHKENAIKKWKELYGKEGIEEVVKNVKQRIWEKIKELPDEEKILEEEKAFLERLFGAEVKINPVEDPMGKRKKARPLRPAVYLVV